MGNKQQKPKKPVADFLAAIDDLADTLNLEGDERSKYVHEHMTRAGYKATVSYVDGDDENDDGDNGSFFGLSSGSGNRGNQGGKNRGSGWFPGQ